MHIQLPHDQVLRFDRPHHRPLLMGVLNTTPDSFSDGGRFFEPTAAIQHGLRLVAEGADLLDIGGESSRPGAEPVSAAVELQRVMPVIEGLAGCGVPLSIDTTKPEVAARAFAAGAALVNDIGGLRDERMLATAASFGGGAIAMHKLGDPRTMQASPTYGDVVDEVLDFLRRSLALAAHHGVPVILDPGIGFGKTAQHNVELLAATRRFVALGAPVLIGVSRKSFLATLAGADSAPEPPDRLPGTLAAGLAAVERGASILRVHDVAAHVQFFRVRGAIAAGAHPRDTSMRQSLALHRLSLEARIGVSDEERSCLQPVLIDVDAELPEPARSDDFATTVDYAAVAAILREQALARPYQLLETLADEMARSLRALGLRRIRIALDKPSVAAAIGAASVGIELRCDDENP